MVEASGEEVVCVDRRDIGLADPDKFEWILDCPTDLAGGELFGRQALRVGAFLKAGRNLLVDLQRQPHHGSEAIAPRPPGGRGSNVVSLGP